MVPSRVRSPRAPRSPGTRDRPGSSRTLESAFREELGLSPAAFIRRLRLHALRRALLASALGESTVTELAYHLGFTQLGRLAGAYRNRFGEPPSVRRV